MNKEKIGMLEEENFRVDSTGWVKINNDQDITYLQSPEGGVWEYVKGVPEKLIGQQLFTWPAAILEVAKAGKRMSTDGECYLFKREDFGETVYPGYRDVGGFSFNLGYAYFWTSSVSEADNFIRPNSLRRFFYLSSEGRIYRNEGSQALGFSVRCLRS